MIDTVIMGNAPLWQASQERDALYAKPHDGLTDADGMRLGELEGIVGEEGGYSAESDAAVLLDGLGVGSALHERKMGELQGGQKVRVLLAQALFGNPTALLLDEPTNNLDLDSVHWLKEYLCEYEGVLLVISHDRHFLNSVCTHTADIDYETHHHVRGRLRRHGGGQDADPLAHRSEQRGAREEDRAAERVHRALLGRHALGAGDLADEKRSSDCRPTELAQEQHPAPVHQVRDEAALGTPSARIQEALEVVRRPAR